MENENGLIRITFSVWAGRHIFPWLPVIVPIGDTKYSINWLWFCIILTAPFFRPKNVESFEDCKPYEKRIMRLEKQRQDALTDKIKNEKPFHSFHMAFAIHNRWHWVPILHNHSSQTCDGALLPAFGMFWFCFYGTMGLLEGHIVDQRVETISNTIIYYDPDEETAQRKRALLATIEMTRGNRAFCMTDSGYPFMIAMRPILEENTRIRLFDRPPAMTPTLWQNQGAYMVPLIKKHMWEAVPDAEKESKP